MHHAVTALCLCTLAGAASAAHTVSFLVDPATVDADMNGLIEGNEFQPEGSFEGSPDGVSFTITATDNLVGFPRLFLGEETGIHFGGGGGSNTAIDFSVTEDILLTSYTLTDTNRTFLGNPRFDIRLGDNVLSEANDANLPGTELAFKGGPIAIEAGTTYTFFVTDRGAAIQSFMSSWQYEVVPAPASLALMGFAGLAAARRRR